MPAERAKKGSTKADLVLAKVRFHRRQKGTKMREGGRHEILMEGDAMRGPVMKMIVDWCSEVLTVQRKTG